MCKAAQSQGATLANVRRIKASRKTQESSDDRNRKFHGGEIAVIAKSGATKKSRREIQGAPAARKLDPLIDAVRKEELQTAHASFSRER
jgi:hypothetical protein